MDIFLKKNLSIHLKNLLKNEQQIKFKGERKKIIIQAKINDQKINKRKVSKTKRKLMNPW